MRIAFFTPEEPTQLPAFFSTVLPALGGDDVTMAVVRPVYAGSSMRAQARRFIRAFGWREFLAEAFTVAWRMAQDRTRRYLGIGRWHSVKGVAKGAGVRLLEPDDINDPAFVSRIRELAPDLIVSVACPQILRRELLDVPSIGCVNVHSGMLPKYRGVLPTFWALANGERETGVTLYFMSEGIDDGDIVTQRRVPIRQDETLHSLIRRCKQVGAELVLETIERLRDGPVPVTANHVEEGTYFSFPKRADVERFRALGRAFR